MTGQQLYLCCCDPPVQCAAVEPCPTCDPDAVGFLLEASGNLVAGGVSYSWSVVNNGNPTVITYPFIGTCRWATGPGGSSTDYALIINGGGALAGEYIVRIPANQPILACFREDVFDPFVSRLTVPLNDPTPFGAFINVGFTAIGPPAPCAPDFQLNPATIEVAFTTQGLPTVTIAAASSFSVSFT